MQNNDSAADRGSRTVRLAAAAGLCLIGAGLAGFSDPPVARSAGGSGEVRNVGAAASQAKLWVWFTDKGFAGAEAEERAVVALHASANPRQAARRQLRRTDAGLFDARDLPVCAAYLDAVAATGARMRVSSRWLNAASFEATPEQAAAIGGLPFVTRIEPVRGGRRDGLIEPEDEMVVVRPPVIDGEDGSLRGPPPIEGLAAPQQAQSGITSLHQMGFTGAGVIIGVLDTGFRRTHAVFNFPGHVLNVIAEHDFVFGDGQTANEAGDDPAQHNHGTYILSQLGAYNPGVFCGGAYDASFVLAKTEDVRSETPIEEDYFVAGLEFVEMHGADLMTASLGYIDWYTQADLNGATAVTTIAVNVATANGLICLTAAGNEGNNPSTTSSHLIAPADSLLGITVGAVDASGATAGFSSDGPTADGRVKPEVMARGVEVVSCRAGNNTDYTLVSGTSLSTPIMASAVACLVQAHPAWTVAQMRSYLFWAGDYFIANGTHDPQFIRGYGVVNAAAGLPDCNHNGIRDSIDIAAGAADCNGNGVPDECEGPCRADFDGVDCVGVPDIFAFLSAWFAQDQLADFNGDQAINVPDIFAFLSAWFAGC